jgi:hypothetical protein
MRSLYEISVESTKNRLIEVLGFFFTATISVKPAFGTVYGSPFSGGKATGA